MRNRQNKDNTPMVSALEVIQKYFNGRKGLGHTYTAEERLHVLNTWFIKGRSPTEVEKYTGVSSNTLFCWMKADWWRDALRVVKQEKQEELDGMYTGILEQTLGVQSDRLEHGDAKVIKTVTTTDEGERTEEHSVMRYPMKGKDAAVIGSIAYQNRALLRGDPTSRVEKISTDELLDKIAVRLSKVGEEKKERIVDRVLDQVEVREESAR